MITPVPFNIFSSVFLLLITELTSHVRVMRATYPANRDWNQINILNIVKVRMLHDPNVASNILSNPPGANGAKIFNIFVFCF